MEKEKERTKGRHNGEVYELQQRIQEITQDLQISKENLSNARNSFFMMNSFVAASNKSKDQELLTPVDNIFENFKR